MTEVSHIVRIRSGFGGAVVSGASVDTLNEEISDKDISTGKSVNSAENSVSVSVAVVSSEKLNDISGMAIEAVSIAVVTVSNAEALSSRRSLDISISSSDTVDVARSLTGTELPVRGIAETVIVEVEILSGISTRISSIEDEDSGSIKTSTLESGSEAELVTDSMST